MSHTGNRKYFVLLTVSALGIVFGDIGTSPLYALREVFFGHHPLETSHNNVIGALSLFFWSLTLVVAIKYNVMVLRINNHGEGGVFALLSLIRKSKKTGRLGVYVSAALIFGACMLYADGLITPAISVLSAVEGLEVVTPGLTKAVVPITIVVLFALFFVQKHGTAKVGRFFGPIMVLWFITLIVMAIPHIINQPEVFKAVNPLYGIRFLFNQGISNSMIILGYVVLCITGGEALYADLGHFGKRSIDTAWFSLVYPAVLINYLGQGAFLLGNPIDNGSNLFYLLVPEWAVLPMVVIATSATIIASQALISGAFSLTKQAIGLGFIPRLKIIHTSSDVHGQIYMPAVNWLLCTGCILLVIGFKNSSALAAAYGIAVTATMTVTTFGFYIVTTRIWGWRKELILPLTLVFLTCDISFFLSNVIKITDGGYVPVLLAMGLYSIMGIWSWGRTKLGSVYSADGLTLDDLLALKDVEWRIGIPRRLYFFSPSPIVSGKSLIPLTLQTFVSRLHVLPKELVFITVKIHEIPYYEEAQFEKRSIRNDVTSIILNYGYMEDPDIVSILDDHGIKGNIVVSDHEIFSVVGNRFHRFRVRCFRQILRLSLPTYRYYGFKHQVTIMKEVIPVEIGPESVTMLDVDK